MDNRMTQPDELLPCYICDGKGSLRCADMRCYCVADRHKCRTCKGTGKIRSARPTPRIDDQVDVEALKRGRPVLGDPSFHSREAFDAEFNGVMGWNACLDMLKAHYNLTRKGE